MEGIYIVCLVHLGYVKNHFYHHHLFHLHGITDRQLLSDQREIKRFFLQIVHAGSTLIIFWLDHVGEIDHNLVARCHKFTGTPLAELES